MAVDNRDLRHCPIPERLMWATVAVRMTPTTAPGIR